MDLKPKLTTTNGDSYAEFVVEPLARGYGVTIGNPLRRVLLSSIPGTAVTSVYIEQVLHEFSTIPGVTEDVIQIILNLKELVVKFHSPGPKTAALRITGPKEVKASDLELGPDAEIINPDLHIASVGKTGKIVMEIRIEEGVGYVPSERHATKDRINSIPVDAVFTPVKRVAYHVEDTRVGQQTDLDRLVLRVWTDGSVTPQDALGKAVNIVREQLNIFDTGSNSNSGNDSGNSAIRNESRSLDAAPRTSFISSASPAIATSSAPAATSNHGVTLDGLGLTTRVLHSLKEEGINSVDDLIALSERDLKKVPGVGERSLDEIKQQLATYGLEIKP